MNTVLLQVVFPGFELNVDLSFRNRIALIGPNGSGKSTLLKAITGAIPSTGEIRINDVVLQDSSFSLPIEERRIGFVPQGGALFPHLTALENVAFGSHLAVAKTWLTEVGGADLADKYPAALSGGQKQLVALGRALTVEPELLLLDEPFSGLDPLNTVTQRNLLAALEIPIVFVTHDVRDVTALAAEVVVLDGGAVLEHGSLQQIIESATTPFTVSFCASEAR